MEQIQFESGQYDTRFNPTSTVDVLPALEAEQNRQKNADQAFLNQVKENNRTRVENSALAGKELEQLAQYSATLTEQLVEVQKTRNKEEMLRGINDAYLDGVDTTEVQAGEEALKSADEVTQAAAGQAAEDGEDVFTQQAIRRSSGWYNYGLAVGQVQQMAGEFPIFSAEAAATTSVEITLEDGSTKTVTLNSAVTPAEYQAVMAQIRSDFLEQFVGVNPAILAEHLFPQISAHEQREFRTWYQTRETEIQAENELAALSAFTNGTQDITKTYEDLVNAGVSPVEARKKVLESALLAFKGGRISEEQYRAILATPYGPGGTWGSANSALLATIEQDIATENIADTAREQQLVDANGTKDVNAILAELDPNLSMEQLDEIMQGLEDKYGGRLSSSVLKPLENYRDNMTLQARDLNDQRKVLDQKYADGTLSVTELRSGKYSADVASEYMSKAIQMDQVRGQRGEAQGASKNQQKAVENTVLRALGVTDINSIKDGSGLLAIEYAQQQLDQKALAIKTANPDMSWNAAYQAAAQEVMAEIREANEEGADGSSPYTVDNESELGFPFFPSFRNADGVQVTADQVTARNEATQIIVEARGQDAFGEDGGIFNRANAEQLSNPNNPVTPQLRYAVRVYNELNPDEPLTIEDARRLVVKKFGLEMARPYETTPYEEVAISEGIVDILNAPTPSSANHVAVQGGLPNLVIRNGVEGGHDIIQHSIALGVNPAIAPLAAVVFGNETGWGKYTSGQNNLFNIKSTDGTGTVTTTREGNINVDGGYPVQAQWRDYTTRAESVKDFWEFLESNPRYAKVLTATTPMEALRELRAAGYATSGTYVQDVGRLYESLGINPNQPFQPQQLTPTPWGNTANMDPLAAVYITGNIGPTSTGPHLDVKRVDGGYFNYNDLDNYVFIEDPELGRVPLGAVPETGDWQSHTRRGSHGRDYGTFSGSRIYLDNGAEVVSSQRTVHGDLLTIRLPNGVQYTLLHGTSA